METQEHTTLIHMQQIPPVEVRQQTGVVQRRAVHISAARVLAIIQSIIGLLTVLLGAILLFYRDDKHKSYRESDWFTQLVVTVLGIYGIIEGVLVCVAGTVGIGSCIHPQRYYRNEKFKGCSVCACCLSGVGIGFFSAAMTLFPDCDYKYPAWRCTQKVFVGVSLSLVITDFIVALIAAMFSCVSTSLGGNEYCENSQRGVIMYPGTGISGQTVLVPAYPPGNFPCFVSYAGNYPNQPVVSQSGGGAQVISPTPSHANQVVSTNASAARAVQDTVSVTYSDQEPPPAYQERQQPFHAS